MTSDSDADMKIADEEETPKPKPTPAPKTSDKMDQGDEDALLEPQTKPEAAPIPLVEDPKLPLPANLPPASLGIVKEAELKNSWLGKLMAQPKDGGISVEMYESWSWPQSVSGLLNKEYRLGVPQDKQECVIMKNAKLTRHSWYRVHAERVYAVGEGRSAKNAIYFENKGGNYVCVHITDACAQFVSSPSWEFIEKNMSAEQYEFFFITSLRNTPILAQKWKVNLPKLDPRLSAVSTAKPLKMPTERIVAITPQEVQFMPVPDDMGPKRSTLLWESVAYASKIEEDNDNHEFVFTDAIRNKRYRAMTLGFLWVYAFDDHHRAALKEQTVTGKSTDRTRKRRTEAPLTKGGEGERKEDKKESDVTMDSGERKVPNRVISVGGTSRHSGSSAHGALPVRSIQSDIEKYLTSPEYYQQQGEEYKKSRAKLAETRALAEKKAQEEKLSEAEKAALLAPFQEAEENLGNLEEYLQLCMNLGNPTEKDLERINAVEKRLCDYMAKHENVTVET